MIDCIGLVPLRRAYFLHCNSSWCLLIPILFELDFAALNSVAGRLCTQAAVRLDNVLIEAVDDASGR